LLALAAHICFGSRTACICGIPESGLEVPFLTVCGTFQQLDILQTLLLPLCIMSNWGLQLLCHRNTNKCVFRCSLPSLSQFTPCHVPQNSLKRLLPSSSTQLAIQTQTFPFLAAITPQIQDTISGHSTWQLYKALIMQNTSTVGTGSGPDFDASSLNTSFTTGVAPVQVNLMAPRKTSSWVGLCEG